jgi:hypothetical protein
MVVRGVYNKTEEEMIEATNAVMDKMVGWVKVAGKVMATAESMKGMAQSVDRWNPFWYDENYAAGTRWGSLIAFPMYQGSFGSAQIGSMPAPKEAGFQHMVWLGEDWDFYKPIRSGDYFKVWRRRPALIDTTALDGKGPRTFALVESDADTINQNDELVSHTRNYVERVFLPKAPVPVPMPDYEYTLAELRLIDLVVHEEEVRGANLRYWEDVKVGDMTRRVVLGPTSMANNAIIGVGLPAVDTTVAPREGILSADGQPGFDILQNPATGLYHIKGGPAGRHWSDRAAQSEGEPHAFLFAVVSRYLMCRLVTNWMGDDAFLRKFNWRHITRNPVGDTLIGYGKVANKRKENGEYLVDLVVWLENLRGNTTEAAFATVSLISKKAFFTWK